MCSSLNPYSSFRFVHTSIVSSPVSMSSASWHFNSMDFALSTCLIGVVFDFPSTTACSALLCLVACRSSSLSSVLQSVDLGMTSSGNSQYSTRCRSSEIWVSFLLWAPKYDKSAPQCVPSSHDRVDFEWGVLHSMSRNRWSVDSACSWEVGRQSMQPDCVLRSFKCCYVLGF